MASKTNELFDVIPEKFKYNINTINIDDTGTEFDVKCK